MVDLGTIFLRELEAAVKTLIVLSPEDGVALGRRDLLALRP
jgi:hypothetical protein